MTEIPGDESQSSAFSHAADLSGMTGEADPDNRAELNAELGFEGVMEQAKPHFQHLIGQLKEPLAQGEYSSILGDDVSGRVPALVVGDIANKFADEHERPHPKQLFFAGGSPGYSTLPQAIKLAMEIDTRHEVDDNGRRKLTGMTREQRLDYREQLLSAYFDELAPQLGQRTLLVTDHVWMGNTVDRVAALLHEKGVDFDIATLGIGGDEPAFIAERAGRPEFEGVHWFSGGDTSEQGVLYSRDDELDENQYRQSIGTEKDWLDPTAKRPADFDGAQVRAAREYLAGYSTELYEQVVQ